MGLTSKAASTSNIYLKGKNEIGFNNAKSCSIFKSFFSNLAHNLVSKLPPSPNAFTESKVASYYNNIKFKDLNFEFSETFPEKILNILEGLNAYQAAGIDNLSGKFLKDGTDIIALPISQLCNLSIKLNLFPRSCKIAKVKPHFKKGSKTDPQNYHPITLLLILSKIIERIIHDQTQDFLSKTKMLYRFQSGFQKNYFTNTCFGLVTVKITTGFEKGLFTQMILIDLQKMLNRLIGKIKSGKSFSQVTIFFLD